MLPIGIRMSHVIAAVATEFQLPAETLRQKGSTHDIVVPRQIAMLLCHQVCRLDGKPPSLPRIGRAFGGKHHTTVLHSLRKAERLSELPQIAAIMARVIARLELDPLPAIPQTVRHRRIEDRLDVIERQLDVLMVWLKSSPVSEKRGGVEQKLTEPSNGAHARAS